MVKRRNLIGVLCFSLLTACGGVNHSLRDGSLDRLLYDASLRVIVNDYDPERIFPAAAQRHACAMDFRCTRPLDAADYHGRPFDERLKYSLGIPVEPVERW